MSSVPENPPQVNAENATDLTAAFLKRLGYRRDLRAIKVSLSGETYIVEMGVEKKTAKVQIDSRTKEIKEYEIQEGENPSGSSFSKGKLLVLIPLIAVVVVGLKLAGVF
jgi:hypothetical protein